MPNYQNGKIYSIRSHLTDDVYIGSTIETLAKRLFNHKRYYKRWLITKKLYTTSFKIIEKDPENCYIELVENYPCNSKNELERREGETIRNTTCVNKNIAGRTKKEYYNNNKEIIAEKSKQYYNNNKEQKIEKNKQYNENNKEQIKEYQKQYRQTNKETIVEKAKQSRENNKEKKAEIDKQYRENNKEKISERKKQKYTCECGSTLTITTKSRHEKTTKHQSFVNSN